jgi:hypothetical protein
MDRKSKIENLNRKYLGGGVGTTTVRSESILSPTYHVDTFQRTGTVNGGFTNLGHNISTLGGVTGGITTIGGIGHGVSTLGGGVTTIGGISGGVTRLGPVSTNVTRVSRISPQHVHSISPPHGVIRTSTVGPVATSVLAPHSYVKPATAFLRPTVVGTPVTTMSPVTTQSYVQNHTPVTYVQGPPPVSYVQAPAQVSYVQAPAQVSYVQAPAQVTRMSTVAAQAPQTITTVTRDVRTEVTQPPPIETTTVTTSKVPIPEPDFEPRRRPYFTQEQPRRVGFCDSCNAMCPPCCGCPWWLALILGLLLLAGVLGALGYLLKGMGTNTTIDKSAAATNQTNTDTSTDDSSSNTDANTSTNVDNKENTSTDTSTKT